MKTLGYSSHTLSEPDLVRTAPLSVKVESYMLASTTPADIDTVFACLGRHDQLLLGFHQVQRAVFLQATLLDPWTKQIHRLCILHHLWYRVLVAHCL